MVKAKLTFDSIHIDRLSAIWAQVTVAPLASSKVVLRRGTSYGLTDSMPLGGHPPPTSTFGLNEEWKKDQKKEKKKQTSLVIKRTIPMRSPPSTFCVCLPTIVASRAISRHHWIIVEIIIIRPNHIIFSSYWLNPLAIPVNSISVPIAPVIGHGLGSTMWNGCFLILLYHKEIFIKL